MNNYWWSYNWPYVLIAGAVLFFCVTIYFAAQQDAKHHQAFMESCLEDHKEYECDALWGQANPKSDTFIFTQ